MSDSLATPWAVALQAPLSVGFSRQEYWSGWPFPSLGDPSQVTIGSGENRAHSPNDTDSSIVWKKTREGLGSSLLTWIQVWTHHSPLNMLQTLIKAQSSNTVQERLLKPTLLATLKYTKYTKQHSYHAIHYIPRTYLPYNWKFVPFDHLHLFQTPHQIPPLSNH